MKLNTVIALAMTVFIKKAGKHEKILYCTPFTS